MTYAVIDTNVIVSALLSKNPDSATVQILAKVIEGDLAPVIHDEIIAEYDEVLRRKKFHFDINHVEALITFFKEHGTPVERIPYAAPMPDEDDRVFFEVSLSAEDSFLITGNLKHYPRVPHVVTPSEMIEFLEDFDKTQRN